MGTASNGGTKGAAGMCLYVSVCVCMIIFYYLGAIGVLLGCKMGVRYRYVSVCVCMVIIYHLGARRGVRYGYVSVYVCMCLYGNSLL